MNELRWILLGIGLVLLALIYLFSRRTAEDDSTLTPAERRFEPALSRDDESVDDEVIDAVDGFGDRVESGAQASGRFAPAEELQVSESDAAGTLPGHEAATQDGHEKAAETAAEPPIESTTTPVMPEKVIALHLMPKSGEVFEGLEFVGAIQAEGLQFGRFDIFHRFASSETATDEAPAVFSLANMMKPGTFNLHDLDGQQFKGASMFLVLPGPDDAVAAFADMLATGRRLAVTLNGQLLDAQGTQLSRQSASHLREDIINYQHGISATPAE